MGGVSVDGRDGEFIKTVSEMLVRFTGDVFPKLAEWERRLKVGTEGTQHVVIGKAGTG